MLHCLRIGFWGYCSSALALSKLTQRRANFKSNTYTRTSCRMQTSRFQWILILLSGDVLAALQIRRHREDRKCLDDTLGQYNFNQGDESLHTAYGTSLQDREHRYGCARRARLTFSTHFVCIFSTRPSAFQCRCRSIHCIVMVCWADCLPRHETGLTIIQHSWVDGSLAQSRIHHRVKMHFHVPCDERSLSY